MMYRNFNSCTNQGVFPQRVWGENFPHAVGVTANEVSAIGAEPLWGGAERRRVWGKGFAFPHGVTAEQRAGGSLWSARGEERSDVTEDARDDQERKAAFSRGSVRVGPDGASLTAMREWAIAPYGSYERSELT